jgi:hypothetical protein
MTSGRVQETGVVKRVTAQKSRACSEITMKILLHGGRCFSNDSYYKDSKQRVTATLTGLRFIYKRTEQTKTNSQRDFLSYAPRLHND